MVKIHAHHEKIKQLCDIMGEDLDGDSCREMLDHMNSCPTCKVYYDTVKKTILICKENNCAEKVPKEVQNRLMKILNLDDVC
jgi:hypothetical protein